MKYIIRLSLGLLLLCGIYSCAKDKGNYDYNEQQNMAIKFPYESVIAKLGEHFTVEPIFIDPKTEEELSFNTEDYSWEWFYSISSATNLSEYILISSEYNLNKPLNFPVTPDPHMITLKVEELTTGRIFFNHFRLRMISKFMTAYAFLVEDASGNVDLELYGFDEKDNVVHEKNHLSTATEFPYTSGGANAIGYDAATKRLYIATGSGMAWLNSPEFSFDPLLNRLENIMMPKDADTFANMIRMGPTDSQLYRRTFLCFTEAGGLFMIHSASAMVPNISIIENKLVQVAPMAGGFLPQGVILLWNKTHEDFAWASSASGGMATMSRSLTPYDAHIPDMNDCVFLGGSFEREAIGVAKNNTGDFWRIDAKAYRASVIAAPVLSEGRPPRQLIGTGALGKIDHWLASLYKGYLYAVANNKLHTYIETQAGGGTVDPGWTDVKITDKDGATVNITKPISFLWTERCIRRPNTTADYYDYIYIVTYDQATGGTVYIVTPEENGQHLILVDTIEGLGNVKKMCYWWG